MTSFAMIPLHFLMLTSAVLYESSRYDFFTVLTTITKNNFLHFLHTTFIIHLLLATSRGLSTHFLGKLSASEQTLFQERVYGVLSDSLLVISFFPTDLDMISLIYLSFLLAVKSLAWVFEIKSKTWQSSRMLAGGISLVCLCSLCAMFCWKGMVRSFDINVLLEMEYLLMGLSLIKILSIMIISIKEIESNRSLYVFIITITYLTIKTAICFGFIVFISMSYKFPFNIARSLLSTVMKLKKKIFLFRDYLKLCKYLDGIEEVEVNGSCVICTDTLDKGKMLRCMHVFHSECLKMWCEREMTCPICRAPLAFKETERTEEESTDAIPIELVD